MARQVLPTDTELAQITNLGEARQWAGLAEPTWTAVSAGLGTLPSLRVFSSVSSSSLRSILQTVRVTVAGVERELTVVESIQVALMWRVARQAYQLEDVDPLADPMTPTSTPAATATGGTSPAGKRIKTSSVLDQLDESEVQHFASAELDQAYRNHSEITGSDPPEDCEPTPEQIAALHAKVIGRGEAPYADFSVLTPFGRRAQRQMKARAWTLQQDGTFRALDVPGPPSFEAWSACWKVYRAALFMLRYAALAPNAAKKVVSTACLEEYYEKIVRLNAEFPEAWHLIVQAEDRCRSEMFERYRRQLVKAAADGRLPMGLDFDGSTPWIGVFCFAARNGTYWGEYVTRPAQNFIARGGKHMTADRASAVNIPDAAKEALDNVTTATAPADPPLSRHPPSPGHGVSRAAKKRRRDREKTNASGSPSATTNRKGTPYQKAQGGLYSHNADGAEICYKFAKGPLGSCPEPCQSQRDHCCQICLGRHPNSQCSKSADKPPGHAKSSGKGAQKK